MQAVLDNIVSGYILSHDKNKFSQNTGPSYTIPGTELDLSAWRAQSQANNTKKKSKELVLASFFSENYMTQNKLY